MTGSRAAIARGTAAVFVDGRRAGSAVLVDSRYLITAAHVLLRQNPDTLAKDLVEQVELEFPSRGLDGQADRATASPLDLGTASAQVDVAVLDLGEDPPGWLPAPVLVRPTARMPTSVEVFGYPLAEGRLYGVWRKSTLAGPTTHGAFQLDWAGDVGTFPGQSGGPVIDPDSCDVIGILVEGSERGRFDRFLPIPLIVQVWPQLPTPRKHDLWPTCPEPECIGVRVADYGRCLAHLARADRAEVFGQLSPGANVDCRGTIFTSELLGELFEAVQNPKTGRSHFGNATFDSAEFSEDVWFGAAGLAELGGSTTPSGSTGSSMSASIVASKSYGVEFSGETRFTDAKFWENTSFDGVKFGAEVRFEGAMFGGSAGFRDARFGRDVWFDSAQFGGEVGFEGAMFGGSAGFRGTKFSGDARFDRADFSGDAEFDGAQFSASAVFAGTVFEKRASFDATTIGDESRVGPCEAKVLDLSRIRVGKGVWVQCRVEEVDAENAHCPDGLNLQLDGDIHIAASQVHSAALTLVYRQGRLMLADAAFDSPATIAAPTPVQRQSAKPGAEPGPAPQLLGLQRVEVVNLTLVGLNLRSCRFLECYNRDQLRIDGPPQFAQPPTRRRWTRRQTLAEEHLWRSRYDRRPKGWFPVECRHPGESVPQHSPEDRTGLDARYQAALIQTAYRDLRKGREDAKDEPGAADFYYGEMEMRRLAAPLGSVERVLLSAYWAISGYGLRATRALAALLILLALGTVGFATVGFALSNRLEYRPLVSSTAGQSAVYQQVTVPTARPGWKAAVDYGIDSVTTLLRPDQPEPLTQIGQAIEITLRLLGPLLLGLAILAVRGRVKR